MSGDIRTVQHGDPDYPRLLVHDHQAPRQLHYRGSLDALEGAAVAIVGTRRCTHYGKQVAAQFGRELAEAGVAVVSGLALGIDGAAHSGALAARGAPVIAVVGSGLDVVYPRQHARLWHAVAADGLLMSEAPVGAAPEPWRFPARNRIIAALAHAVVVVDSHAAGGSNHTVAAAIDRGVPVMAVPGPITSPASIGTNRLLAEGCPPATHVDDVLVAIGLTARQARKQRDGRPPPGPVESQVLAALGWSPSTLETISLRSGLNPSDVAVALTRLDADKWARSHEGWWERLAPPQ